MMVMGAAGGNATRAINGGSPRTISRTCATSMAAVKGHVSESTPACTGIGALPTTSSLGAGFIASSCTTSASAPSPGSAGALTTIDQGREDRSAGDPSFTSKPAATSGAITSATISLDRPIRSTEPAELAACIYQFRVKFRPMTERAKPVEAAVRELKRCARNSRRMVGSIRYAARRLRS